jgi:hypothetical protein
VTVAQHPEWCARGHRCGLGEHRAEPLVVSVPGAGRIVLTRVRGTGGRDYAEVTLRLVLPAREADARTRLAALLSHLRALVGPPRSDRTGLPVPKGDVLNGAS